MIINARKRAGKKCTQTVEKTKKARLLIYGQRQRFMAYLYILHTYNFTPLFPPRQCYIYANIYRGRKHTSPTFEVLLQYSLYASSVLYCIVLQTRNKKKKKHTFNLCLCFSCIFDLFLRYVLLVCMLKSL